MDKQAKQHPISQPPKAVAIKVTKRLVLLFLVLFVSFIVADWFWPLPVDDFEQRHFAQVVVDKEGYPLRAFADSDGVWRYPVQISDVSPLYIEALLNYEDRYFYQHFGVNPLAILRALGQRVKHGRFVSGASTLTMQVARILKPHKKSLSGKISQMFMALQLEWHYSKQEILTFYLNYAPFGGPIEGVQAASYTYLDKPVSQLSHSEAAMLAVLPQAPSRFRPDRHVAKAQEARDKVLDRMLQHQVWGEQLVIEAKQEPIWATYKTRPMLAPLLTRRLKQQYPSKPVIASTIDIQIQTELEWMLKDHIASHPEQVSAAVLVVNNEDMSTLAYLGSADFLNTSRQGFVDMVTAIRSPGSTLKPFIYGLAIDEGLVHSQSLLFDVPQSFAGYRPKNFTDAFSGPVSLSQALMRSLNMPAVQVLEKLTPETFYVQLKNAGLSINLPRKAEPNLSLALGGGGVSMEQLVGVFSALGRKGKAGKVRYTNDEPTSSSGLLSEGAAWIIQDILSKASLKHNINSRQLAKQPGIAFKTGTSYGFRDAWVLASNQKLTVGIWVGQPDGSFSTDNSGRHSAVPLLNKILAMVPGAYHQGIEPPMTVSQQNICWPLGYKAIHHKDTECLQRKSAHLLQDLAPPTLSDPMNRLYTADQITMMIDDSSGLRVTPECAQGPISIKQQTVWPMVLDNWLPFHWQRGQLLPDFSTECRLINSSHQMTLLGIHDHAIIYPEVNAQDGPSVQLELAGSTGENYWFLNGTLINQSGNQVTLKDLSAGKYQVQVIDSSANQAAIHFEVHM